MVAPPRVLWCRVVAPAAHGIIEALTVGALEALQLLSLCFLPDHVLVLVTPGRRSLPLLLLLLLPLPAHGGGGAPAACLRSCCGGGCCRLSWRLQPQRLPELHRLVKLIRPGLALRAPLSAGHIWRRSRLPRLLRHLLLVHLSLPQPLRRWQLPAALLALAHCFCCLVALRPASPGVKGSTACGQGRLPRRQQRQCAPAAVCTSRQLPAGSLLLLGLRRPVAVPCTSSSASSTRSGSWSSPQRPS